MSTHSAVDDTELPSNLAETFRQAGDSDERPGTLEEGFSAVTARLNEAGVTITLEDMFQSKPTRHAVHVGESVEHVPCVMDALIVALLHDADTVEIRSKTPGDGETIRFRVAGDEVSASPTSTVVSFGLGLEESMDPDLDSLEDTLNDPVSPVPTTCSVINAFPDSDAYERWVADITDAAVMALSVEKIFTLSQQVAQSRVVE